MQQPVHSTSQVWAQPEQSKAVRSVGPAWAKQSCAECGPSLSKAKWCEGPAWAKPSGVWAQPEQSKAVCGPSLSEAKLCVGPAWAKPSGVWAQPEQSQVVCGPSLSKAKWCVGPAWAKSSGVWAQPEPSWEQACSVMWMVTHCSAENSLKKTMPMWDPASHRTRLWPKLHCSQSLIPRNP